MGVVHKCVFLKCQISHQLSPRDQEMFPGVVMALNSRLAPGGQNEEELFFTSGPWSEGDA